MKIAGVDHLAIAVSDLERSERFYTEVLGGTVIHRHGDRAYERAARRTPQVVVALGEARFALCGAPPEVPQGHFVHWALQGRFEDLDGWLERFRKHGVKYSGPYGHGGVGLISIYFPDPDGYLLEITVDAGSWERAKAAVKQRNGLFGNPLATYDADEWDQGR